MAANSETTPRPQRQASGDIQVITRSAQILRMLAAGNNDVRIADVAAELKLGRTSAHRYLSSMATEGLLERVGDGSFRLGPLLAGLGTIVLSGMHVVELAEPHLRALASLSNQTAVMGIWAGANAVAVRSSEPVGKSVNVTVRVGNPLQTDSAQGVVFLSFLRDRDIVARVLDRLTDADRNRVEALIARTRDLGYALSDVVIEGVRAIAAPVLDQHGDIAATIALVGTTHALDGDPNGEYIARLLSTASDISTELGFVGELPYAKWLVA